MRKLVLNLLSVLLLSQTPLLAQNREFPNALHVKLNLTDYTCSQGTTCASGKDLSSAISAISRPF